VTGRSGPRRNAPLVPRLEVLEARETPSAGALDPSFGTGGRATFGFGLGADVTDRINDAVVQPDGKIVMVGSVEVVNGTDDFAIMRLNPDGSPDLAFGAGGVRIVPLEPYFNTPSRPSEDVANAVALLPDGRIVVAGSYHDPAEREVIDGVVTNNGMLCAVVVLKADGTIDTAFGRSGRFLFGRNSFATDVAVRPDGRIVVVGTAEADTGVPTGADIVVHRLRPDRRLTAAESPLDQTFGTAGSVVVAYNFGDTRDEAATAVALQPDGKIVIAGTMDSAIGDYDAVVIRLNADGSRDNSFDGNALRRLALNFGGSNNDRGLGVAVQPDGRIVLTADATLATGRAVAVARFGANGTPDASFGSGGVKRIDLAMSDDGLAHLPVALDANGRILIAAATSTGFYVARMDASGALDPAFGTGGSTTVTFPGIDRDNGIGAIMLQSDGRILVTGFVDVPGRADDFAAARLLGAAAPVNPDPPAGGSGGGVLAISGSPDGSVRVLGPGGSVTTVSPFGSPGVVVRAASADVNRDGVADVVVVTGPRTRSW